MFTIPGRIPITIHPIFWIVAALIGWVNSMTIAGTLIWVIIILVSVLWHEMGHALTAIAFGQRAKIDLIGFGGVTNRGGPELKKWQDFLIILNGPLAGFLLALIALFCASLPVVVQNPFWRYLFFAGFYANVFWTVLNLLPIQPLDGGQLVRILCEKIWGFKGFRVSLFISMVLAGGLALCSFIYGHLLIGMIFMMFTFESYRSWQQALTMVESDQDKFLRQLLQEAAIDIARGEDLLAAQKLAEVRGRVDRGVLYISATELLAELLEKQGREAEAFQLLEPFERELNPGSYCRLHRLAWKTQKLELVTQLGDKSYQIQPGYEVALLNAYSYSLLGEVKPAIGWLQRAISDGLPDAQEVLSRHEFDKIRKTNEFSMFS